MPPVSGNVIKQGQQKQQKRAQSHHQQVVPVRPDVVFLVACDHCGRYPIRGTVFRSLSSPDVNLCLTCFSSRKYPTHIFARINTIQQYKAVEEFPQELGGLFAVSAMDFDTDGDRASIMYRAAQEFRFKFGICNGCGRKPLRYVYYRCLQCPLFLLCRRCGGNTSFHSNHVFAVVWTKGQDWVVERPELKWPVIKDCGSKHLKVMH